jgi:hypothetical protein
MSNIQFPPNPENGMIFEAIPGIFYSYNAGSNCWNRLKGVESLGLATPLSDGLMSKEDFAKLQNLILPPPQVTIKGEECNTTFKSGTVALQSFDQSLDVSKNLRTLNQTPQGTVETETPWSLHHNTAGFDFRVPINRLLQEIEQRNLLKQVQLQGDQGAKGPRGEPGKDRLDTGPIGPAGEDGANSPFTGGLVNESIPFESISSTNRAIVDLAIEEISEDENYLIATRANIGNPDACPALISPKDFKSALIVALNTIQGGKLIKDQVVSSTDCSLICRICASSVHHLNIQDILDLVFDQFVVRVERLKFEKEKLVKAWLGTMVSLFNEQKSALCCALENCRSRGRNQRTRQYIETQRIQAALGNFQLLVDGEDDRQTTDMDGHKNCPVPAETVPSVETEGDCTFINLDSKIHISDPRANSTQAVTTFLPQGTYIAEITSCCPNLNASFNNPRYSGRAAILYQSLTSLISGEGTSQVSLGDTVETRTVSFPDFGTFENISAARNAYEGLTLSFEHAGGDVSFWILDADGFAANNSGILTLTIKSAEALTSQPTAEEANGFLYVYRDEISFNGLLGRITPFSGALSASENFGSVPGEVDLTFGPALLQDRAQVFFYDGSDGLSLFFVAGEQAGPNNDQQASLLIDMDVTNNTTALSEKASDDEMDLRRLSASQFQASSVIDGDSTGFAIGELDPTAEYSVRVDPKDLSTMRTFVAASADGEDILISQGGSAGIGGDISVTQLNSAPIAGVSNIPSTFGGGNTDGLRLNNENSGQNVTLTRPIVLDIPATVDDVQLILQDLATGSQFVFLSADGTITSVPPSAFTTTPGSEFGFGTPELIGIGGGGSSDPVPPNVVIRTFGFADQDFADIGWQAAVRERFEGGSSSTTRRLQGGNLGAFRETTHSSAPEERVFSTAGRPTKAFFGPGSSGALIWEHFWAGDQFGNTWLAIRDTNEDTSRARTGARPLDNGANAIYLRDATEDDLKPYASNVAYASRLSVNVLGGLSGVESGTIAASWTGETIPPYSSVMTTYHVQQEAIFNPSQNGAVNSLAFSVNAQLIPAATSASSAATIPPPPPPPPPDPLPQDEVDTLLAEREALLKEIDVINQQLQAAAGSPAGGNTLGQLHVQLQAAQTRLAQVDIILAANSAAIAAGNAPPPEPVQSGPAGAPTISGSFFVGAVVFQGGQIYRGPGIIVNNTGWFVRSQGSLKSSSFQLVNTDGSFGGGQPDFSTNGTAINLGYFVESNHNVGNDNRTIGIDNWNVDVGAEFIPPPTPDTTIPPEILDEKGGFVGAAASGLARGTSGAPQDPCIIDVCASIRATAPQSLRYIFTDRDGNKYFSNYRSINIEKINEFQFFSFGPVASIIAPPEEYAPEIISGKNLDLSLISDQLSAEDLRKAESLEGIARLTFVQELLGAPANLLPNGRMMTDLEIEFRSMPYSSVDLGYVSVKVGIPGSTVEIVIDNFTIESEIVGETVGEPEQITSSIKRVVASQTGTDSSTTGLIYSGFDSYFGDYATRDGSPNFHGNNFVIFNQASQRLAHVNARTGFQDIFSSSGSILTSPGGTVYGPDAIAVDDFGVVYVADGPAGRVDFWFAVFTSINFNAEYGDIAGGLDTANVGLPGNTIVQLNTTPLPPTAEPALAIGRYKMIGGAYKNDIIANFNNRWYQIDGVAHLYGDHRVSFREDITTPRCCFGAGNPPGPARAIANTAAGPTTFGTVDQLAAGPAGTSLTTNAPANPQPTLPIPWDDIGPQLAAAIQEQLDDEFNQFNFYSIESSNVYEVNPTTGSRTLVQELGENAFCLRAHPRTGDLYYVVDNRGTDPVSGTTIRRLDINDLDDAGRPKIKTVFSTANNEGIFGITFGNSVPSDPTLQNQVLYALLSTLETQNMGNSVRVRVVEVAEQVTPPVPSMPISQEVPLNSVWNTYVTGGRLLGNPSRVIFSRLVPGGGCQMHYKQVQWYERGWRIGSCCGALVEVGGVHYIVAKRSIGTDTSCGGGESLGTSCIRQFIDIGEGHPAIAWPTIPPELINDPPGGAGEEFLGLPTSGFVNFVKDETLSNEILTAIRNGNALRTIGSPSTEIPFILFPAA